MRGKMLNSFGKSFSIRFILRASMSFLQISFMPGKWLIFCEGGGFKHLVNQTGSSEAEQDTKQEKNDLWQQTPGNVSFP